MDYKEKLEKAKELYPTANADQRYVLECLFPELAESEDEKMRKEIISFLQLPHPQFVGERKQEKWLAWLEKQVEQKPYGQRKECSDCQFNYAGECKGFCQMKRNEQKPVDKVEPKFKVKYAGSEYNVLETKNIAGVTFYGIEDEPNHIDYVKADNCEIISGYGIKESGLSIPTKPVMFSEKNPKRMISAEAKEAMYDKPAWSEEDEKMLDYALDMVEWYSSKNEARLVSDWLKSLKDRVQPQKQWKPTKEQMDALLFVVQHYTPKVTDKIAWDSLKTLELMYYEIKQ